MQARVRSDWQLWQAAQPSPGGQGDQRSDLVPGIVRCAKCQFQLVRSNLNMYDGTVTAGDSKTEPCPNGCGPLWPLTWETWAREGWAEAERLHLENAALSAQPSPGGQGALADAARRVISDIDSGDYHGEISEATYAALEAALAARQPVGEPVAEAIEQLADDVESCVSDACGYLASDSGWDDYGIYRDDAEARYRALPDRIRALAATPAQAVEMSPEFTDTARAAIAWVLWHHQGGSSPVGQPLRFALGMGQHDRMTDQQIAEAKRFAAWANATTEDFHQRAPAQAVDLGHLQRVDPEIHHDANGAYGEMTPNDDGEWVRFSDVESLLIGRKGGR